MSNLISAIIGLLVIPTIFGISQNPDNMCYKCAWLDDGRADVNGQFDDFPTDSGCRWGAGKPDDKFLVNCTVEEEEGYQYFYRCLYLNVKGALIDETSPSLNGTFYGCGVRRVRKPPPDFFISNSLEMKASKLCQQDRLDQLIREYQDATGKEFLQNLTSTFQASNTRAHMCSCDFDCWEPERDDETTTSNSGDDDKSTDSSGGNGQRGSCEVIKYSILVLIALFIMLF